MRENIHKFKVLNTELIQMKGYLSFVHKLMASFCHQCYFIQSMSTISLIYVWYLLLWLDHLESFSDFSIEIIYILEKVINLHDSLIKKHSSNFTSKVLTKCLSDTQINCISNELFLFTQVLNLLELLNIILWRRHLNEFRLYLLTHIWLRLSHLRVKLGLRGHHSWLWPILSWSQWLRFYIWFCIYY